MHNNCIIYDALNNIGIATLNSSLNITSQKGFNFKSVNSLKQTFDNNFILASGQYPFNTGNNDFRYGVFKVSNNDNSCIDTTISTLSLNNLAFNLSSLSFATSIPSITVSNFTVNPVVSNLQDTSLCHMCNLSAYIATTGNTTICSGDSVTLIANAGMASYLWNNGQTTQSINATTAGNYSVTITDSSNCSAIENITITASPEPSKPVITQNGNSLMSSSSTGNQWFLNGNLIPGATSQIYNMTGGGFYQVQVDSNGCKSMSAILNVVGIEENEAINNLRIYPNPVSNELIIEAIGYKEKLYFEIFNSIGQSIYKGNLIEKTIVQTTNFAQGVYLIKLNNGKSFEFKKIVKE